jgi:SNF2 family DNA or RNA helicase
VKKRLQLRTRPYPHQVEAMRHALAHGNHAFFFEPRLGKTKAALDTAAVLHHRGEVERVAVIAPLIALDVWVSQIEEHCAVPARVKILGEPIISIRLDNRHLQDGLKIFLVNYDKFSRRGIDEVYRNEYLRQLERWDPDLIVLDESHRCKRAGAVRSQALWRMVSRQRKRKGDARPYVFLLSGTPNPKGYIDLFAQFRILEEGVFGTNKASFEERYCEYGVGRRRYTIIRYRRVKEILRKVDEHSTIVTSKQAGLAGKQIFNPISVRLPAKVRRAYDRLAEEFITEIQGQTITAKNFGVRRMRLLQLTGGFTTDGKQLHDAKLKATADYLADLREQEQHVVVYARYLPEVAALTTLCYRLGYHTDTIRGGVPRRIRTEAIAAFQQVRTPSALVFQSEAGSLAIELTAAAEVFFYSLPDGWETFYQCLERVRGPKQKRPVRYTFLIAKGTVDHSVLQTLRRKRDMHADLMKNPRDFLYGL